MVRKGRKGREGKGREEAKKEESLRMVTPPGKVTASRHISAYPKVVILSHFLFSFAMYFMYVESRGSKDRVGAANHSSWRQQFGLIFRANRVGRVE